MFRERWPRGDGSVSSTQEAPLAPLALRRERGPPSCGDVSIEVTRRVGRYVLLERIGRGGMGDVYAAHDSLLGRKVALKLQRGDVGQSAPRHRRGLLREAHVLSRLSHAHLVTVYDMGEEEGRLFMVMEFIDGCTLDQWLRGQPRPWREIVRAFLEAGQGLAAAHAAGLVHRDFKPANVMVDRDGRVRVVDFGLVTPEGASGTGDEPVAFSGPRGEGMLSSGSDGWGGTPSYMAPEQHLGLPTTRRADQFSFCLVLYQALYERHPHGEPRHPVTLAEHKLAGVVAPPPPRSEVPTRLHRALLRGLRPKPDERWPSMAALLAELERLSRHPSW